MGGKADPPESINLMDQITMANLQNEQQREFFKESTTANRPEQITPWGSTVWEDLGDNQWRQTTELDPELQRALDIQQQLAADRAGLAQEMFQTVREDIGAPISWEALEANPVGTADEVRDAAEEALYSRTMSRLDPTLEQQKEQAYNRLWNQGLRPGDEAWNTAMGNLERAQTDARQTAINEAIIGGGQEASRTFNLDMARRQQALAEQLKRRTQALSEMGMVGGADVAMPGFSSFTTRGTQQAPDYLGMLRTEQQSEWDRYNAKQGQRQGFGAGMAGMAAQTIPMFFGG